MKKILHITSWYPNQWDSIEGIFVKNQYKVFSEVTDAKLINVQVRPDKALLKYKEIIYSNNETGFYLLTRIKSSKVIEILTTLLVIFALLKSKYYKYNLLQFHIAYPLLTYYSWWKYCIKTPVFISEHWSAYHMNFNLPNNTNKLGRIKNIFKQKIPVITVSKALLKDIQEFSDEDSFPSAVIPNVIDKMYRPTAKYLVTSPIFFIVNVWREIKNPFPMLEAFSALANKGIEFNLRIGGYGDLLYGMEVFVKNRNLESKIKFLGKMDQNEIEDELNKCDAYLFSSEYETFSVACADALSCGCPLIGSPIPAILEYANDQDMVVVEKNNSKEWEKQLFYFITNKENFDRNKISQKANSYFSKDNIQELYKTFITSNFNNA